MSDILAGFTPNCHATTTAALSIIELDLFPKWLILPDEAESQRKILQIFVKIYVYLHFYINQEFFYQKIYT